MVVSDKLGGLKTKIPGLLGTSPLMLTSVIFWNSMDDPLQFASSENLTKLFGEVTRMSSRQGERSDM